MATFLFDDIVFGPVKSRRLGASLGINLLPVDRKVCTFNCIYCECGWTGKKALSGAIFPSRRETMDRLENVLAGMKRSGSLPDAITFAGNGEPTLHPEFPEIIDGTISLRDRYCPRATVAILSNSTMIHKPDIARALNKVDMNILKLDTVSQETFLTLNQPQIEGLHIDHIIRNLKAFRGRMIIQSMFVSGTWKGKSVDNTHDREVNPLIRTIRDIGPEEVMVYTIEREPAGKTLAKAPPGKLKKIAGKIEAAGIPARISY